MPIEQCTLPEGGSGFRWGKSGHCYPERADAERQAAAAHANGYTGDQRVKITDKAGAFRFYTTEPLGPHQSLTPEGFLLCENVPIARTGTQLYSSDEIPVEGIGGRVTVHRDAADVFRPETMASFEGKSVTIDHPDDWVAPGNWKDLTHGVTQNVRRGGPGQEDLLIADLLITDEAAIIRVRGGLREVSCGYDADYEQTAPGVGYQRNIVGNHVALVERGRAGPRCAIQDKEPEMAAAKPSKFLDRLLAALKLSDADAEEFKKEITSDTDEEENAKKEKTTDAAVAPLTKDVATLAKTVDALVKTLAKDADLEPDADDKTKDGELDPENMTADMILTAETAGKIDIGKTWTGKVGDSMREIAQAAEILCPGFKVPTTDSVKSLGAGLKLQTQVLATESAQKYAAPLLAGRSLDSLKACEIRSVFNGAAAMARHMNNSQGQRTGAPTRDFGKAPPSIAEINKANQAAWAKQTGNSF